MGRISVNKSTGNYTVMRNFHLKDKRLKLKTKGLLSIILSLPDDWDFSANGLATLSSDGIASVRSALKELEEFHYLVRTPVRKDGKIFDWNYEVYECPYENNQDKEESLPEDFLVVENQQVENQVVGNRTQLNTKELNTKELNTVNNNYSLISKQVNNKNKVGYYKQDYNIARSLKGPRSQNSVKGVISLTLNDKTEHPVTQEEIDTWKELYPAVDVLQALRNMKGWLNANPTKRKTRRGINRFINNWLAKEQDRYHPKAKTTSYSDDDEKGDLDAYF